MAQGGGLPGRGSSPVVLHTLFDWSVFSLGALGRRSAITPSAATGI